jgi:hypothetical protein
LSPEILQLGKVPKEQMAWNREKRGVKALRTHTYLRLSWLTILSVLWDDGLEER